MEKENDSKGNLTLDQSKSNGLKTPEKKKNFKEEKENGDRKLKQRQKFFDFRSPKKLKTADSEKSVTPQKEKSSSEYIFKTPEKKKNSNLLIVHNNHDKNSSPQKKESSSSDMSLKTETYTLQTVDEDLISEIDQAKLLIAETKNLPKSVDKTPVKDSSSESPRRLLINSPGTPGRQKRVELITLASPKSKMMKLM